MNIPQIKAAMNEKLVAIQSLAAKEESEGKLTAEDLAEFAKLETEHSELAAQLGRQERSQSLTAQTATPVTANGLGSSPAVHVKQELKNYPGAKFTRLAMSVAAGKGNVDDAVKFATSEIGDNDVAMAITTASDSGGSLVPENWADEVIELLTPRTVVRELGARSHYQTEISPSHAKQAGPPRSIKAKLSAAIHQNLNSVT